MLSWDAACLSFFFFFFFCVVFFIKKAAASSHPPKATSTTYASWDAACLSFFLFFVVFIHSNKDKPCHREFHLLFFDPSPKHREQGQY